MRYKHVESDYAEDDSAETRVYFDPVEDPTDPGPPTVLPDPLATVAYERASVRTFDAGKLERWQVPTLAAPVPPHLAPTAIEPPVIVAPELASATQRPWLKYAASYPLAPAEYARPPIEHPCVPVERTHPVKRIARPARGIAFAVACVLVGIAIGGAIAVTSSSRGKASAAPAQVATLPAPAVAHVSPPTMTVTPIAEAPAPAPAVVPPAPKAAAAPAKPAAPQQVEARARPRHAAPAPHEDDNDDNEPDSPAAQGTLDISSKPPCAIAIDGKPTGLVTPKRGIELPAGSHQVTLTNSDEHIQVTTEVEIFGNDSTRLVKDFTK